MSKTTRSEFHDFKIVLVRHGQASGEERPGELGAPLTSLGEKQAARVAKRLAKKHFTHIYTSDLSRAYYTGLAIRHFHPSTPFTVTASLREIRGFMNHPGRAPGGKAVQEDLRKRRAEIKEFARQILSEHTWDDQILIAAHGNLIRFLVSTLAGVNPKTAVLFKISNTSLNEVIIQNGRFLWLYRTNDVHHLLPQHITKHVRMNGNFAQQPIHAPSLRSLTLLGNGLRQPTRLKKCGNSIPRHLTNIYRCAAYAAWASLTPSAFGNCDTLDDKQGV